jgi:two-component system phosphate regulon sensor histidine kinase PhoR
MRDSIINQPEKREKYAKIIQLETERLQNQVERILQLATMEREQIQVSMAKADMQSIVERVVSTFELNIDAIGGKISYIDQAKNHFVLGDEFHLFNIISNLIDNAIKYAKAEPIIEIKSFNEGNYLVISVTDNGVGIEPNEIKYIFDRFYRVPQGNLHDTKGFGIGLNYVKVMLEKHGGHVEVLSTPKKGSTFTVFLPAIK